jgi:NDP-sugar pyrophosphorylase family protein
VKTAEDLQSMAPCLEQTDIVILAGGQGTRLRPVISSLPKILVPIAGRPMLDRLFDWLQGFGPRRVVLALGHMAHAVERHVSAGAPGGLEVTTVIEARPLGTGGALRFAADVCQSDPILVLNGDTLLKADLCAFLDLHRRAGTQVSLMCSHVSNAAPYGRVEIEDGRIGGFYEKDASHVGPGYVSAGVYLFARAAIAAIPDSGAPSLERDVLSAMPGGSIAAFSQGVRFLDIGTPESLAKAGEVVRKGGFGGALGDKGNDTE